MRAFSYDAAFDRNIGWLTEWEQQALRGKRVALAGMGGVGGVHMLTLARFGVGSFHISDFDRFDIANFNRQIGANMATLDRPKAEVLNEMALAINPELEIRRFDAGIDESNIDAFLDGVDVFVDGFDFFVLGIRRKVFDRCAELGIPALCAAPIGMGVGFLAFLPGRMSFEEYFRLAGQPETEQYLRFLVGLVPRALHRAYLVDPTRLDLAAKRGPSTGASCQLCSGVAAVAAVKLMLRRGGVMPAPYHHHYDPYVGRLAISKLRWGNNGPLQRLKLALGVRQIAKLAERPARVVREKAARTPLEEILNVARWAPSGDNVQPWQFEPLGDERVRVHLSAHARDNVYEFRAGEPTLLAGGALLESLAVAASAWGRRMEWRHEGIRDGAGHTILVDFIPDPGMARDRLYGQMMLRSVDRRRYRMRALSAHEMAALERAAGADLVVEWHGSFGRRWDLARLNARATDIRLRLPEAYLVHRSMLDFERRHSPEGIPAGAIGLDRGMLAIMRWGMRHWSRLQMLNRLGGTWSVAAELDLIPGIASAAFFTMRLASDVPVDGNMRAEAILRAGRGIQRFWLEATQLGLAMQPSLATLVFAEYGATSATFTVDEAAARRAGRLATAFRAALGKGPEAYVFMGRIGEARTRLPFFRSIRRDLAELVRSPGS